jgi:hypothetical protein
VIVTTNAGGVVGTNIRAHKRQVDGFSGTFRLCHGLNLARCYGNTKQLTQPLETDFRRWSPYDCRESEPKQYQIVCTVTVDALLDSCSA